MAIAETFIGLYHKMKFKAAILTEIKKPLEIVDLEVPKLKSGQVLVKIFYSSVCGSQLNEINGLKGEDKFVPHTLGHEGYGEVVDVGGWVSKVRNGDRVVVSWIKGNGLECEPILYGGINSGKACTLSEYSVVSENRIVPVALNNKLEEYAPLLGCCIPTGAGVIKNQIEDISESRVLVLGLGGVGTAACIWSSKAAKKTYGHDICADRKNVLSILGLQEYNNSEVDYVIDVTGNISAFKFGWEKLTKGTFIMVGNPPKDATIEIDPFDLIKGNVLMGSAGGDTDPDRDIPLYSKHLQDFSIIVGNQYKLEDINIALSNWGSERKPIIRM